MKLALFGFRQFVSTAYERVRSFAVVGLRCGVPDMETAFCRLSNSLPKFTHKAAFFMIFIALNRP
jgi:hypothetical protein